MPGLFNFVQTNATFFDGSTSSLGVAFTNAQTLGNINIVVVSWNDATATIQSVSDTAGNSYIAGSSTVRGTGLSQAIYYAANIPSSVENGNTITVNFAQSALIPFLQVFEYAGEGDSIGLYSTASKSSPASTPSAKPTVSIPALSGQLVFVALFSPEPVSSGTKGFTSRSIITSFGYVEDEIAPANGTIKANAVLSASGNWVIQGIVLQQVQN